MNPPMADTAPSSLEQPPLIGEVFLTLKQVRERTARSTTAIYVAMANDEFPRPLKRGRQSVWVASEVQAAIDREIRTLPRMGKSMGARTPETKKAAV